MLKNFRQNLFSELMKIVCSKVYKIVALLVIGAQGILAYVAAKQNLFIGLDATPETCPELLPQLHQNMLFPPLQQRSAGTWWV